MPITIILYFILFIVLILVIYYFVRAHVLRRKTTPVKLFFEALKHENSEEFETAVHVYQQALSEAKRLRGHSNLEEKITAKLKLLNTVIAYRKGFDFPQVASHTG